MSLWATRTLRSTTSTRRNASDRREIFVYSARKAKGRPGHSLVDPLVAHLLEIVLREGVREEFDDWASKPISASP